MWAEAQIDKVRLKDDYISKLDFPSLAGNKFETQDTYPAVEGNQSPLLDININNIKNEASPSTAENQRGTPSAQSLLIEKPLVAHDFCPGTGPDNSHSQMHAQYSKRSRSQLKSYISHIAEEMYVYRSLPLGQDRRRNRYWQFVASASSNDPGSGRIFVEHHDGSWRLIDSEEVTSSTCHIDVFVRTLFLIYWVACHEIVIVVLLNLKMSMFVRNCNVFIYFALISILLPF